MIKTGTKVFTFDYLQHYSLFKPLRERVRDFPGSTERFTRHFMVRLSLGDDTAKAQVVTYKGKLVGHTIAELDSQVLLVHQCLVDDGFPRAIDIFLTVFDTWAMSKGASLYRMEVSQHPAEIWAGKYKRYGFKVKSYNVEREIK